MQRMHRLWMTCLLAAASRVFAGEPVAPQPTPDPPEQAVSPATQAPAPGATQPPAPAATPTPAATPAPADTSSPTTTQPAGPTATQASEPAAVPSIDQEALLARIAARDANLVILDVRTPEEYAAGHVEGAVLIPYDQMPQRAGELEGARDKDIVLYCRSGRRSALAAQTLQEKGFTRLLHLDGDILAWQAAQRPVVTQQPPPK